MTYEEHIRGDQPDWGIKLSAYFLLPQRIILSIMGFLAIINGYTMRICLSVAITRMVPLRNYTEDNSTTVCEPWSYDESAQEDEYEHTEIFDWSQSMQGLILGSFYVGYIIGHLPAGLLSEKFGGKWVLAGGVLFSAISTLLTPPLTRLWDANAMLSLRVIMGLAQGALYPSLNSLLGQWVPLKERGILGAFVLGGGQFGNFIANIATGFLLQHFAWTSVFYAFGTASVVWFAIFSVLCYSDPLSHPFIKLSEKEYLFEEMGYIARKKDLPMFPWGHIFRSAPFYGLLCGQTSQDWTFYVMVADMPKYMNDVMQFRIQHNGFFSSLSFALMWVMALVFGALGDLIIRKEIMTITRTRKFMTLICAVCPSVLLVLASYAGCNHLLVVALFTIGMGFMGAYYGGIKLTALDMSPNYCGTIMALVNGTAAIGGFVAPYTVGLMTPDTTLKQWRNVFWLAFFIRTVGPMPYFIWASGEVQEWNDVQALEEKLKAQQAEPPKKIA